MYEPDDYEIEEEFESLISNLSFSKDSIGKTTKYAMEYITYSSELFYLIVKKFRKCSVRRKIALFYLIDSIVQNSRAKARNEYILLTAKYLNYLIDVMLYPLFHISNPTAEQLDDKDQCIKTVNKVLNLWETRNTLCIAEVPLHEVIKEAYNELAKPSYPKSPVRDPITKKRYSPYAEEDEHTVDDILKKIEEYRRENKRIRWESRLRPAKEHAFAEFEELWEKVTMEDVRATIKDYDLKMAYLEGTAPKPFSPGSSMSPPSPSPSTPYSPSVTVVNKRGGQDKKPQPPPKYSPSSPNSSPESKSRRESSSSSDRRKSYSGPDVFIWDLDETLIIVNSLPKHVSKKNRGTAERLIRDLEDLLYEILDDFMFYKDLRDHDQVKINDLLNRYDDGRDLRAYEFSRDSFNSDFSPVKLSYRYRVIRDIYNGRIQLRNHISEKIIDRIDRICSEINDLTDGWLSEARKTLELATSCRDATNILVSSGHMVSTVAKMVIFRLNGFFDLRNIWASGTTGKRYCFDKILRDFPRNRVSAIGDGHEEEKLSREFDLPFYKIRSANDLYRLGQTVFKNL